MPNKRYLFVADATAPLASGEAPLGVMGLARALGAAGAGATILSLGIPEQLDRVPGLARRLRTIRASTPDGPREIALYEGKAPLSQAAMVIAGAVGGDRMASAVLLAEAVRALGDDGLIRTDVAVAWGETAALALSRSAASVRVFVVPSGRLGPMLTAAEFATMESAGYSDIPVSNRSLAAIGAAASVAIIAPSASSARVLEADVELSERASDEPFVAVRFGCDDPPHDPATDASLPAVYSGEALGGKAECRRAVVRRYALATGPRTLLLGTASLRRGKGGEELLAALDSLSSLDVAILVPGDGDADLLDRVKRLALHSPGRLAVLEVGDASERLLRAATDAILLADLDDRTGRAAGLAQRYGCLPIAIDGGASRDYLVDYDAASATGSGLLYGASDAHEIAAAVSRAIALRSSSDAWTELVRRLMESAPRWSQTAATFDEICSAFV